MSHDPNSVKVSRKRPIVVIKRATYPDGKTSGCITKTKDPSVTEFHNSDRMLENYTDGVDYIIEKGTNVSELIIVRRLTDKGMSYHFRAIHDGHENNNFSELPTEVRY